ncbi:hypothetical protein FIBSPDRAFT_962401 [Athelia psychrophila]|uniref:Uncharacterized protein n=1 Tax=Athelia psychrophila TaxID=1759441 RepID=A0A166A6Q6_9AGAM|nr:hypothetical protein FIBSPDRAFT_962401 [Fibularhizoctonia sp. CBS 109695]
MPVAKKTVIKVVGTAPGKKAKEKPDKDYRPHNHRASEESVGVVVLDVDVQTHLYQSESPSKSDSDGDDGSDAVDAGKQKHAQNAAKKPRKNNKPAGSDREISTEEESDGKSAINKVCARAVPGRRGPKNLTLQHWHTPVAVVEPGAIPNRWEFKCKHCNRFRSVPRKPECDAFKDEVPSPAIGNLATHTRTHDEKIKADEEIKNSGPSMEQQKTSVPIDHGYTAGSAKLMEGYLLKGKLNPKIEPTRKGFFADILGVAPGGRSPVDNG